MRFNFLGASQLTLSELMSDMRIDEHMRKSLSFLGAAICLLVFTGGVEQIRLAHTRALEFQTMFRLRNDEQDMANLRSDMRTVSALSALAKTVRTIRESGERKATELTEIGNRLPQHSWISSLHQDHEGLVLHGDAKSYAIVSLAMQRFEHGLTVSNPVLLSSGVHDEEHPQEVEYDIRLKERVR